jgi:hypothetical protein
MGDVKEKKSSGKHVKEVRVAGVLSHDRIEEMILEPVRPAEGFGRWIYCKYCYKNVKPMLSGINQIMCSVCGCGLTPDFLSLENLKSWLAGDESAIEEDMSSEKMKVWLRETKMGKHKLWKLTLRRLRKGK